MGQAAGLRTYDGAVAVVTGGASGIGRALGEGLARRGADVVLADLQFDLASEAAEAIRKAGGRATAAKLDVTDSAAFTELVNEVTRTRGRLDYLFNNAGIGVIGRVHLHEGDHWDRIVAVNLGGVIHGVRAAYPIMTQQGFGHIVNTASITGLIPAPGLTSYSATKHAVVGLSNALRVEAAAWGVRVSVFCPGLIRTAIIDGGRFGTLLETADPERRRKSVEKMGPMEPDAFADEALRAVASNRAVIVIPSRWRIPWWLYRLSPSLGLWLARKRFEGQGRDLDIPPPVPAGPPGPDRAPKESGGNSAGDS